MSVFGWSYPPGCSGPPDDGDVPCEICWQLEDKCVCRTCPTCGAVGHAGCYRERAQLRPGYTFRAPDHHGLTMTNEQWRLRFDGEKAARAECATYEALAEMEAMAEQFWNDHP